MIGLLAVRLRSKFYPPNSGGLIFTLLDSAEVGRLRNFNPHFGDEDHGVKRTLQRPALSIAAELFTSHASGTEKLEVTMSGMLLAGTYIRGRTANRESP